METASQTPTDGQREGLLGRSHLHRPPQLGTENKGWKHRARLPVTFLPDSCLDSPKALPSQPLSSCQAAGRQTLPVPGQRRSQRGHRRGSAGHYELGQDGEEEKARQTAQSPCARAITKDLHLSALHFNGINEASCHLLPGKGPFLLCLQPWEVAPRP